MPISLNTPNTSLPHRQPEWQPDEIEILRVSSALEYAQAALVLGEQRAWTESTIGRSLAEVQPSSRGEYASLSTFYRPPDGQLVLARLDGEPVGVAGIHRIDDRRAEGKRMYVRPSARGLGLARQLMHETLGAARELGFASIYMETSPVYMPQMYDMAVRLGFHETKKLGFTHVDDVLAMELDLEPPRVSERNARGIRTDGGPWRSRPLRFGLGARF